MSKTRILLLSLLLLTIPAIALAFDTKVGNSAYVGKEESIAGNLYAAGSNITVDGTVEGDVICAGQSININGTVEGSVRLGGQSININGQIKNGVQAFGSNVILGADSNIGWDMLTAGAFVEIRGNIGRDLHGAAANVLISGKVGNDVKFRLDEGANKERLGKDNALVVEDGAEIGGNLYYTAGQTGVISNTAVIHGDTGFSLSKKHGKQTNPLFGYFWTTVYSAFASLVIGLVVISFWRKKVEDIMDIMLNKANLSLAFGIAITFLTPFLVLILFITLIGIPLALIILMLWLILLYTAKILTAVLVGRKILDKLSKTNKSSMVWAMVIGICASWFIFSIPLIGWIMALVATWWSAGAIMIYCKNLK